MAWDIMAGKKRDTMLGAERRSHHPRRDFLSCFVTEDLVALYAARRKKGTLRFLCVPYFSHIPFDYLCI